MYSQVPGNIQQAFSLALAQVIAVIPQILAVLALILLGLFVGKWLKWLVIKVLSALKIGKVFKGSPIEKVVDKTELSHKIEFAIGTLVQWLVILVFLLAAANMLGLSSVSDLLSNVLHFIPRILSAILVFVLGVMVAGFAESFTKASLSQLNPSTSRLVGRTVSYIILIFTVLASLAELGVAQNLINILFIGFVAMLALSFGLAFGLGGKDLVTKLLDEWYTSLKKETR